MHTGHVIAGRVQGAGRHEAAVVLRPGATVAARVASLEADGSGTLALAGALVRARLPKGVRRGQRLSLQVLGRSGDDVVLRARPEDAPGRTPAPSHPAGLPDELRRFLEESGDEGGGARDDRAGEAAFVLRTAGLGPVEVHVRLTAGAVRAAVLVDAGAAAAEAQQAAPDLRGALADAVARPASVLVAARPFEVRG